MIKWLKKCSYIIMLLGTGLVYLAFVDNWQVYAKPIAQIQSWYQDSGLGDLFPSGGTGGESTEESGAESSAGRQETGEDAGSSTGMDDSENGLNTGDGQNSVPPENGGEGPSVVGEEGSSPSGTEDGSGLPAEGSAGTGSSNTGSSNTGSSNGVSSGENGEVPEAPGEGTEPSAGEGDSPESSEPVYTTVEDDYFADAVFIGDSRTVGMFEYGGLEETAAFYASTGLTVYKMFDSPIVPVPGQKKKITVEEALQQNTFAKIYLMIGINEMGTGTVESFLEAYGEAVAHLRELQPEAIIYVQGIIRVTSERSAQGDYINNEGIDARNEGIARLADNEKVFYLDVNPMICDETGGMIPEYTFDGVHLKAKYIEIWKDYLKSHAISS